MLSRHVIDQYTADGGKSYQPAISHFTPQHFDCCFLGASMASVHDLDTFENIAQPERQDCCDAIAELAVATSAMTGAVADPAPALVTAAVVPAAASELCVLPPTLPILPAAGVELGRAFGSGHFFARLIADGLPGVRASRPRCAAHHGASRPRAMRPVSGASLPISPAAQAAGGLS